MPVSKVAFLLAIAVVSQAIASSLVDAQTPSWRLSDDGDYVWSYRTANGENKTWAFEPSTKIVLELKQALIELDDNVFVYRFEIANGADARQSVDFCMVDVGESVSITQAVPQGWFILSPANGVPRAGWRRSVGVRPGSAVGGFEITGRALPAPAMMRCRARYRLPAPPRDLPASALLELDAVQATNDVGISVLSAIIDPALDWPLLAQRVARLYGPVVQSAKRVDTVPIRNALAGMSAAAGEKKRAEATAAVERLRSTAERWASETTDLSTIIIAQGLQACAKHLLVKLRE